MTSQGRLSALLVGLPSPRARRLRLALAEAGWRVPRPQPSTAGARSAEATPDLLVFGVGPTPGEGRLGEVARWRAEHDFALVSVLTDEGPGHALEVRRDLDPDLLIEPGAAIPPPAILQDVVRLRRKLREARALASGAGEAAPQRHEARRFELLGRLSAAVAHDFNNLLTVIGGTCALLEQTGAEREHVQQVRLACDRAAALVRRLLDLVRRRAREPSAVDVNALIERAGPLLQRLAGERVELSLTLSPDLPPVRADPVQLEQVLLNLVANSRDAMPAGGDLRVETRRAPASAAPARPAAVVVSVRDTGRGMEPAVAAQAFEPFFSTKLGGSAGLGLATVREVVAEAGGWLALSSRPGEGTTVEVHLPEAQPAATPAPQQGATASGPLPGRGERLLVVEDQPDVRALLETLLTRLGYTVRTARHGGEAIRALAGAPHDLDLLVTDVVMPHRTGLEVAQEAWRLRPDLPVLLVSGFLGPEDAPLSELQGPRCAALEKPFELEELAATLRLLLERRADI